MDTIEGNIMHALKQLQGEEGYYKAFEEWCKLCGMGTNQKRLHNLCLLGGPELGGMAT